VQLDSGTLGVAHPLLPCGVDLVLSAGGKQVRTEVVARGPVTAGREFDLTQDLARRLGVSGEETIRWRFAG
jgi:rare lipoprotein A (peptidoglycan hydrolase)